jgi:hypothetical protein
MAAELPGYAGHSAAFLKEEFLNRVPWIQLFSNVLLNRREASV